MLFSFEFSSTLMTAAGLGFLGYYIGGDVWVEVSDFVARRISGMPELGQMLATSWVTLTKPWTMLVVGTTIFITVLGFNLIGEGLRQNLDFAVVRRRGIVSRLTESAATWFDQNIGHPVATIFRKPAVQYVSYGVIAIALLAFLIPYIAQSDLSISDVGNLGITSPQSAEPESVTATDTPHTDEVANTQSPEAASPAVQASIDWLILEESGFDGGPVLSSDGETLYVISNAGIVYALQVNDVTGDESTVEIQALEKLLWQVQLPAGGIGKPAIDSSGNIYAADLEGGLSKITPDGEIAWQVQSDAGAVTLSGPVITPDNTIYYTAGSTAKANVQAISPQGVPLWSTPAETSSIYEPLSASKDGKYLFLKEDIFLAQTGELIKPQTDLIILEYFPGEDGNNYLISGQNVIQWELADQELQVVDIAEWDSSEQMSSVAPTQAGVTADSTAWLVYTSPGGSSELVWVTMNDEVLGITEHVFSYAFLAAMRPDLTSYVCGNNSFENREAECTAMMPAYKDPIWTLDLGPHGVVKGGIIGR